MKWETLAVTAILSMTAASALAAPCADRSLVVDRLQTGFGEEPIAAGMSRTDNAVLEIYAGPEMKSWSIVVDLPDRGLACLAATGHGHSSLENAIAGSTVILPASR